MCTYCQSVAGATELLVHPVCTYCQPVCTYLQSVGRTTGTTCVYLLSLCVVSGVELLVQPVCTYCQSVGRTTGTTCVYLLSVSGENYWYTLCVLIVSQWGELLVQPVCTYCQSVVELLVQPVCTYCQSVGRTTGTPCVYLLSVSGENYWYNLCVLIVSQCGELLVQPTGTHLCVLSQYYWYNLCVLIVSQCGELLVHPVCTYCQSVWRTTGTTCVYLLSVSELLVHPVCTYCQSVWRTTGTACVYLLSVSGYNLCVLIVTSELDLLSVSGENYWYNLCVLIYSQCGELLVHPVCIYCQSVGRTTGTTCVYLLSVSR